MSESISPRALLMLPSLATPDTLKIQYDYTHIQYGVAKEGNIKRAPALLIRKMTFDKR